jgi:N-acetyl-1-D-myo-inositol-2-amino-2-deoxy-alpha-D-glucopyranoside deacetylase
VFTAAVQALVEVICEVRPHVVITYDDLGSYGHPDHIMAHRVTTEAVRLATNPLTDSPWTVSKLYWTALPRSVAVRQLAALDAAGTRFAAVAAVADLGGVVDDAQVTTAIDASGYLPAKLAALTAHATQLSVDGEFFALSNGLGQAASGTEYFRLMQGEPGSERDADGRERDLFAGLDANS